MTERTLDQELNRINLGEETIPVIEVIGGHQPDVEGVVYADQHPDLQNQFLLWNYTKDAPGGATGETPITATATAPDTSEILTSIPPKERALILARITPDLPEEADRIAEARKQIDEALALAKEDPEMAFMHQLEARGQMPQLVPSMLSTERNIVIESIENRFKAAVAEQLRATIDDPQKYMEEVFARAYEGYQVPKLPSDPDEQARWQKEFLKDMIESICFRVHLTTEEALINSVMHGNKGDRFKSVVVAHGFNPETTIYTIKASDEGDGFDPQGHWDPTSQDTREIPSGRGMFLMEEFSSNVEYSDGGRTVTMQFNIANAVETSALKLAGGEVKDGTRENEFHEKMRKASLKELEDAVTSSTDDLVRMITHYMTEQAPEAIFHQASEQVAGNFDLPHDSTAAKELIEELKSRATSRVMSQLKQEATEFATAVLRNEYRVDTEAPVDLEIGIHQSEHGPQLVVVQLANSMNAVHAHELDSHQTCRFPNRECSPVDEKVPTLSWENLKRAIGTGILGAKPDERIDLDLANIISNAIDSEAAVLAKREIEKDK